jgi:hypothetical protein
MILFEHSIGCFSFRLKADFIRTKYQQMAYINRLKDETNGPFEDLHLVKISIYWIQFLRFDF